MCEGLVVENPVTKLSRILLEVVEMIIEEGLQSIILSGVRYPPEPPGYVTPFVRPASEMSVVEPVVILYPMKYRWDNTLDRISFRKPTLDWCYLRNISSRR